MHTFVNRYESVKEFAEDHGRFLEVKLCVQVTEGWLEPLLDVVARNSSVIACPVIDTIQDDTFEYMVRLTPFQ